MDPAWADAALAVAAEQLRDKKQLEAACQTIAALAKQPAAVIRNAVLKLDLPTALLQATSIVLGERKRQRDW
jgi:hypothetical protein